MSEENIPAVEQGTGTPIDQIPTDFKEYERWRSTGELPTKPEDASQETKTAPPAAPEESASEEAPEPAATTAPDSEPDDVQEAGTSRGGSRQRKIDRLIRENSELLRRIELLERPGPAAAGAAPQPPPVPETKSRPDLNDYKTLEDYTEALTEWKLDQREEKRKADEAQRAAEAVRKSEQDSWTAKEQAAQKAHPDYQELIESTPIPQGPGVMAARQALLEDDHGAEILYWLAKNPAELKRIAALSPVSAVVAIGKLSAAYASPAPENPKPKVSSAFRPPSPISHGTVKTAPDVNDEDFARRDFRGWNRAREAQLKGK